MRTCGIMLTGLGLLVSVEAVRGQANKDAQSKAAQQVDYERDIKPILTNSCVSCHGGGKVKAGLRLDSAAAVLSGGNTGPIVLPGNSAGSVLIQTVTGGRGVKVMPPKTSGLPANQVALLKAWIDQGAKAPASEPVVAAKPRDKSKGDSAPSKGKRERGRRGRMRPKDDAPSKEASKQKDEVPQKESPKPKDD